jgi:hypothetical protein
MAGMTAPAQILSDRAVISITGPDSRDFLQRVITTDMSQLAAGDIRPGALLTPQGKVLADFLVHAREDGLWIDVWQDAADSLVKRLTLYRLRADAQIERADDHVVVTATGQADPRSDALPHRAIMARADVADGADGVNHQAECEIGAGVPAFGRDYHEAEVFPTDVNLDLYGGIGWKKGCFIGQEVLSRMKRRGTIRKRSVAVFSEGKALEAGHDLGAGELVVGPLTSANGHRAIARIRTDRLEKAEGALAAGGIPVEIELPPAD